MSAREYLELFFAFLRVYGPAYYERGVRAASRDFSLAAYPQLDAAVTSMAMNYRLEPAFLADALLAFKRQFPDADLYEMAKSEAN